MRTISNMVDHLGDELDFRIVTMDRDMKDVLPYPGVKVEAWTQVGKAQVYYCGTRSFSFAKLIRLIAEMPHDVIYLNSFFDPVFTLRFLLVRRLGLIPARPVIIAPRGELSDGAKALKRWKKVPYLVSTRVLGLYRGLIWQASSEHEAADIRRTQGYTAEYLRVVPDLPPPVREFVPEQTALRRGNRALRVIFLSRITPMKNLEFALHVLRQVTSVVEFNIYGPIIENAYWRQCQVQMAEMPTNVKVCYKGSIEHSEVSLVMATHDLLFLPTRGENFGHVILEALSAGTPVLISDKTLWKDVDMRGCTAIPLDDANAFVQVIEEFAAMGPEQRSAARMAAKRTANNFLDMESLVRQSRQLFQTAIGGLPQR